MKRFIYLSLAAAALSASGCGLPGAALGTVTLLHTGSVQGYLLECG